MTKWLELQRNLGNQAVCRLIEASRSQPRTVQRKVEPGQLNVVGEWHDISDDRRADEKEKLAKAPYSFGDDQYWTELDFTYGPGQTALGDSPALRMLHSAVVLYRYLGWAKDKIAEVRGEEDPRVALGALRDELLKTVVPEALELALEIGRVQPLQPNHPLIPGALDALRVVNGFAAFAKRVDALQDTYESAEAQARKEEPIRQAHRTRDSLMTEVDTSVADAQTHLDDALIDSDYDISEGVDALDRTLTTARSEQMHAAAEQAASEPRAGVWKVGDAHVEDLAAREGAKSYTLTTEADFNAAFDFPKTDRDKVKR